MATGIATLAILLHPVLWGEVLGGHPSGTPPFDDLRRPTDASELADIEVQMLPFLCHTEREIKQGRVPLWNPFGGIGAPFLGNQQSAVLHPFTLLGLLFGWRRALTVIAALRLALAHGGAYLLAYDMGMGVFPAGLAALAFSTSGFTAAWLQYPMGGVIAHTPLILALARRMARGSGGSAPLVAALASSILEGHLEYLPVIWLVTSAAALAVRPTATVALRTTAAMALAAAIAAPMLLPCAEYMAHSATLQHRMAHKPKALIQMSPGFVVDSPRGTLTSPPRAGDPHRLQRAQLFLGPTTLYLAGAAAMLSGNRLLFVETCLAAALAWDNPVSRLVLRMPPLSWIAPDRLFALVALCASLLMARGATLILSGRRAAALPGAGAMLATVAILGTALGGAPTWLETGLPALALLLVALSAKQLRPSAPWVVLAAALGIERTLALAPLNRWDDPSRVFPPLASLAALARVAGHDRIVAQGRALLPNSATVYAIRDVRLYDAIDLEPYAEELSREGLTSPFGVRHRAPSPSTRSAGARFVLAPGAIPRHTVSVAEPERRVLLAAGQTRVVPLDTGGGYIEGLSIWMARGEVPSSATLTLARDGHPVWSQRIKERWLPLEGWKDIALDEPIFTLPRDSLTLELFSERGLRIGEAASAPPGTTLAARLLYDPELEHRFPISHSLVVLEDRRALPRARLAGAPRDRSAITFVRDESTRVEIALRAPGPDQLVLADAFYPGWKAWVDGRPVGVTALGSLRSVTVGPGPHRVLFLYLPASFRVGLFVGLAALIALAAAVSHRFGGRGLRI